MNTTLKRRVASSSLLALALAAAGCTSSDGPCESSTLCDDGELCFEGQCVSSLPAGSCAPPTDPYPYAVGSAGPSTVPACSAPPPVSTNLPTAWLAPLTINGAAAAVPPAHVVANVGDEVRFDVPPGTASITIHSQATAAALEFTYLGQPLPNSVVPTAVTAPNGHVIFDDMASMPDSPERAAGYYGGVTPWTGSFGLPDTWPLADLALSRGELPSGTWSFRVNDWNAECGSMTAAGCSPGFPSGQYDLTVVTRPGPFRSTGTLDVAIYLVGGTANAATARDRQEFRRFVDGIGTLLGRAGICLGTVTFFDVTPAVRSAFSSLDICGYPPCDDLSQLFSFASPTFDGVHLFLVDSLDATLCSPPGSGSSRVVGIDGSIPGPSGLPGARTSGAAMTFDDITMSGCFGTAFTADFAGCAADRAAYIATHEMGHWLGLYHTTEGSGATFDPLPDTPRCPCDACGGFGCNSDYGMAAASCVAPDGSCGGGDNLMFWLLQPPHSRGTISTQQALLMRLNAAVK